jgi:hypothetical protein
MTLRKLEIFRRPVAGPLHFDELINFFYLFNMWLIHLSMLNWILNKVINILLKLG